MPVNRRRGGGVLKARAGLNVHRHERAAGCEVEKLLSVGAPLRREATGGRDHPLRPGARARRGGRERTDKYLVLPRRIRIVSDPTAVGRELSQPFLKFGLQENAWLKSVERQYPKVFPGLGVLRMKQQEPAVAGP